MSRPDDPNNPDYLDRVLVQLIGHGLDLDGPNYPPGEAPWSVKLTAADVKAAKAGARRKGFKPNKIGSADPAALEAMAERIISDGPLH